MMMDDKLEKISEEYGISPRQCLDYRVWELSETEIKELSDALTEKKLRRKQHRKWLLKMLRKRTGLPKDILKEKLRFAKECGFNEKSFVFNELYNLTEEQILEAAQERQTADEPDEEYSDAAENIEALVMKATGWNAGKYRLEYLKCKNMTGCSEKGYYLCRMYEKSDEENLTYFTDELKRRLWYRYAGSKKGVDTFRSKEIFSQVFSQYLGRTTFSMENVSFSDFCKKIEGMEAIVFKEDGTSKGLGFMKLTVNESDEQNREVYETLSACPEGIVEEYIIQHEDIASFYPDAVNTVRIITSVKDGKAHLLCGIMRIAVEGHVDNWSQSGLAVGIDMETGTLCTKGTGVKGDVYEKHPVSGKPFKGFHIPSWDKVTDLCLKAALVVEDMGFIGWDVAIKKDGSVALLEGNHGPSATVMQEPMATEGIGLIDNILPYVDGIGWKYGPSPQA